MAKVKPVRGKRKASASSTRPGGVSCIILVCAALALFMLFTYFVLSQHAK